MKQSKIRSLYDQSSERGWYLDERIFLCENWIHRETAPFGQKRGEIWAYFLLLKGMEEAKGSVFFSPLLIMSPAMSTTTRHRTLIDQYVKRVL
jgi:hypothetical protein